MSKKLIALLLSAALCGTILASCGNDNSNDTDDSTSNDTVNEDTTDDTSADTEDTSADTDAPGTVTIAQIHEAVKNAYGEEYLPNMLFDAEMFATKYGVEPEWVEEMIAEEPMISFNVDTFIVVKPTEGNEDNVFNALNDYANMLREGVGQYPANAEKVKAVQCYTKGGYVFFYMLGIIPDDLLFAEGDPDEIAELQYNAAVANNQKATDAINALLGE